MVSLRHHFAFVGALCGSVERSEQQYAAAVGKLPSYIRETFV